jgi:hypothetical protein
MSVKITSTGGISALGGLSARQAPSYFGCAVGIGTYPTEANLEICSNLNQQHLYIQGSNDSVAALARIKTIAGGSVLLLETGTTSDSRDILKAKNSSGTVLNLQADGMLGIGTEHPNKLLTVAGEVSASGGLSAKGGIRIPDEKYASFGDSQDMLIYHGSGNNWVTTPAGGNLMLQSNGLALRSLAQENYLNATANASVDLYYDNSKKFGTTSTGTVTYGTLSTGALSASGGLSARGGICIPDGKEATFGDASDLRIYHNGSNSYVRNTHTGDFFIRTDDASSSLVLAHGAEKSFLSVAGGRAELRYDDSTKFETTSDGTKTTGAICGTGNLNIDGNSTLMGNLSVRGAVTCIDTRIETTSAIEVQNAGTGPAILANQLGSQPVVDFQDDGTSAFYIEDGGNVGINTSDPNETLTVVGDISATECFRFPGGLYLKDGTSSSFQVTNGNGYLQIGPQNGSYSHFVTDRARYYFNQCLVINSGVVQSYDEDMVIAGNYTGTACDVIIKTDGTDRIHIEAAGNVGIGEAVPNQKFTVAGNISASGGLSAKGKSYFNDCVGIGVANPDQLLEVGGNIRIPNQGKIVFGSAGTSPSDYLELYDVGTSGSLLKLVQDGSDRFTIEGVSGDVCVTGSLSAGSGCHVSVANSSNGGFISGSRDLADIFATSSGNIDGSGTTCHVPYFSDANTIASSCTYFNSSTLTNRGAISGSTLCTDGFLYAQCGRFSSNICVGGNCVMFANDAASAYLKAADALFIESDYDADDTDKHIIFQTGAKQRARVTTHGLSSSGGLSATGSYGATNYFAGNVGIGTNKPDAWLTVSRDNDNSGNQFYVSDTEGVSPAVRTYTHGGSPAGLILNHYYAVGGSSNEYMRYADFVANVGSGAGTTMRLITKNAANTYSTTVIDNNGNLTVSGNISACGGLSATQMPSYFACNVGIGTNRPASKLQVQDGGVTAGNSIAGLGQTPRFGYSFHDMSTWGYTAAGAGGGLSARLSLFTDGAERVSILHNGNLVGIGEKTPAQALTVAGNISALGSLSAEHVAVCNSSYGGFISGGRDLADIFETCSGSVDGSGTKFKIPQWTDADTIGDSVISAIDTGITIDGCVGIRVTDPTSPLHVEGPFTISRTGVEAHKSTIDMDGNFRFAAHSGYSLTFHTDETNVGGTEIVRFRNDTGNVGIGNTEAGQKLTVSGNVSACGGLSATQKNSYFACNVGIGTNTPQKALEISAAGTSGGGVMRLASTGETSAGDAAGTIQFYNGDTTDYTPGVFGIIRGVAGPSGGEGHLQFLTDMPSEGADASTVAMQIHSNASVGIGSTSPNEKLTVAGNISACGDVCIGDDLVVNGESITVCGAAAMLKFCDTTDTDDMYMTFANAGTTYGCIGYLGATDLDICTNNRDIGLLPGTANVGIGETAPVQKLTVSGNISATGTLSAHNHLTVFRAGTTGNSKLILRGKGNSSGDEVGHVEFKSQAGGTPLADIAGIRHSADETGCLAFSTSNSERMRIDNNGCVGINEDSIDAYLHLSNSTVINQKFERPGNSAWRMGIPNGQTYFAFDDSNDDLSTPEVVFDTAGCVGIGTAAPTKKLTVMGAITACGDVRTQCGIIEGKLIYARNCFAGTLFTAQYLSNIGEACIMSGCYGCIRLGSSQGTKGVVISANNVNEAKVAIGVSSQVGFSDNDAALTVNGNISAYGGLSATSGTHYFAGGSTGFGVQRPTAGTVTFADNCSIRMGDGGNMRMYHNGTNNLFESHGGDIIFYNYDHGNDIIFCAENTSGTAHEYFRIDSSAGNTCFTKEIRTADGVQLQMGTDNDMQISHNGANGFITNNAGCLCVTPGTVLAVNGNLSAQGGLSAIPTGSEWVNLGAKVGISNDTNHFDLNSVDNEAGLHIKSKNDVALILEADTDNSGESDNPKIKLIQDGAGVCGAMYLAGNAATSNRIHANSFVIGNQDNYGVAILDSNYSYINLESDPVRGASNVGIHTMYPNEKLTVNGNISARGGLSAVNIANVYGSANNYFAGCVGIGTNRPLHELTVAGAVSSQGNVYIGNSKCLITDNIYARDSGGLHLHDDGGNIALSIEDGGQVGVGTTGPIDKFQVCAGSIRIDSGYSYCFDSCASFMHYYNWYFCNNVGHVAFDQDATNCDIIFCGDKGSGKYTFVTMDMSDSILDVQGPVKQQTAINAQTGTTYQLVLADHGKLVTLNNGSAITLTIPPNSTAAFPTGTEITLTQLGAGQVTIAAGSGVTLYAADSELKTRVQYSSAVLTKIASDTWIVAGDLTA